MLTTQEDTLTTKTSCTSGRDTHRRHTTLAAFLSMSHIPESLPVPLIQKRLKTSQYNKRPSPLRQLCCNGSPTNCSALSATNPNGSGHISTTTKCNHGSTQQHISLAPPAPPFIHTIHPYHCQTPLNSRRVCLAMKTAVHSAQPDSKSPPAAQTDTPRCKSTWMMNYTQHPTLEPQ